MSIFHKTWIVLNPVQLLFNGTILSASPDFGFAIETDMTFVHSDFRLVQDVALEYFTGKFTSFLCTSVKVLRKNCGLPWI